MLSASKSPVVIHCLGSQVVLNLTPKGGYRDVGASTAPDKGNERAQDNGQAVLLPAEPCGESSCLLVEDREHQASLVSGHKANETPVGVEEVDETVVSQCGSLDAGSVVIIYANNSHYGSGMEVACHEVAKLGKGRVHKKNKDIKDKNRAIPEISMTLVHGDCVVLSGDDFEVSITPHSICS